MHTIIHLKNNKHHLCAIYQVLGTQLWFLIYSQEKGWGLKGRGLNVNTRSRTGYVTIYNYADLKHMPTKQQHRFCKATYRQKDTAKILFKSCLWWRRVCERAKAGNRDVEQGPGFEGRWRWCPWAEEPPSLTQPKTGKAVGGLEEYAGTQETFILFCVAFSIF